MNPRSGTNLNLWTTTDAPGVEQDLRSFTQKAS